MAPPRPLDQHQLLRRCAHTRRPCSLSRNYASRLSVRCPSRRSHATAASTACTTLREIKLAGWLAAFALSFVPLLSTHQLGRCKIITFPSEQTLPSQAQPRPTETQISAALPRLLLFPREPRKACLRLRTLRPRPAATSDVYSTEYSVLHYSSCAHASIAATLATPATPGIIT